MMEQDYYSCEEVPVSSGYAHKVFEGYGMADLQELAKNRRLKQLEFTQTRNLKMILNEERYHGPYRKARSKKGPPSEPRKTQDSSGSEGSPCDNTRVADPDDFGDIPRNCLSARESNGSIRSGNFDICPTPPQSTITHTRHYFTPSTSKYHHHHHHHHHPMPPPCHGCFYPPPPYHNHHWPMAAPPAKASCADLSCENVARCRMM